MHTETNSKANGKDSSTTAPTQSVAPSPKKTTMAAQLRALDAVRNEPAIITEHTGKRAAALLTERLGEYVSYAAVKEIAEHCSLAFSRAQGPRTQPYGKRAPRVLRMLAVAHRDLLLALGLPVPDYITLIIRNASTDAVLRAYASRDGAAHSGEPQQGEMFDDD